MKQVYIITDNRTSVIEKVFSKRNKAADYVAAKKEPCWYLLTVHKVE